jgi:poly-gamma-glutamate synthesis protein (capsule biosynthesis protein)
MVETYRFFADLGVTAIIGHHTHFASGWEVFKGVPIFYNLGNFLFDYRVRPDFFHWYEGYFLVIYANKNAVTGVEMHPYVQCRENVGIHLMEGEEKSNFINKNNEYSKIIQDDLLLLNHWEHHCRKKHIYYLSIAFRLNKLQRLLLRKCMFFKSKKSQRFLLHLFNTYHCDAHREVMVDVLQREIDQLK